jgi:NAD(P)-dependent dehydrogenase (short-subunit alcohol dehydrogenase family)
MTKFALVGLVRSIHGELERRGIRINALCPGAVATPLIGEDPHAWFGELGITALEPEDLAATVVDLLGSDRTGEVVLHSPGTPVQALEFPRLPQR